MRPCAIVLALGVLYLMGVRAHGEEAGAPEWSIRMTAIEACSCPMFCQCYFSDEPASHGGGHAGHGHGDEEEHFCRFNMAWKVEEGEARGVSLDGVKFWIAGDLGANFGDGRTDWAVLTFDPAVTPQQREAITKTLGVLFPVTWDSFKVAEDAPVEWQADKDRAEARLDGGKQGEVILNRFPGNTDDPIVIHNLRYWAAPRNEGFVLMPNEVQAYRAGEKPFEFKGSNGFMITVEADADDVKKRETAAEAEM